VLETSHQALRRVLQADMQPLQPSAQYSPWVLNEFYSCRICVRICSLSHADPKIQWLLPTRQQKEQDSAESTQQNDCTSTKNHARPFCQKAVAIVSEGQSVILYQPGALVKIAQQPKREKTVSCLREQRTQEPTGDAAKIQRKCCSRQFNS